MHRAARTLALAASVLLAACAPSPAGPATPAASPSGTPSVGGSEPPGAGSNVDGFLQIEPGSAGGPGVSIDDAMVHAGMGPVLVNGSLLVTADGTVLLCSAMAESFPPQCGGTRLEVQGLDLSSIPDLQEANGVRWADQPIQLFGTISLAES